MDKYVDKSGGVKTFRKHGQAAALVAEAAGLSAIAATGTVRIPVVLDYHGDCLTLEYLALQACTPDAHAKLGTQLAAIHRHSGEAHGWNVDNFLGRARQPNGFDDDWQRFFATQRIGFQLNWAARNGHRFDVTAERLCAVLDHAPLPSLLHGDLWSGNHGMLPDGTPVVFDPAVHYGDRECDLAMAALFGGFGPSFYTAYEAAWPLPEGWPTRRLLYQLYHVLNHLNLFGGGYRAQAEELIAEITSAPAPR